MVKRLLLVVLAVLCLATQVVAQDAAAPTDAETTAPGPAEEVVLGPMQDVLQSVADLIAESSRRTIQPAIDAVAGSGLDTVPFVLETWQARDMWQRTSDGLFFKAVKSGDTYELTDFDTGEVVATVTKDEIDQIKPNSGIQGLIGSALVAFQLNDPDPAKRRAALASLERNASADLLAVLRASIETEEDPDIKARKERLEKLITITYGTDPANRIAAIEAVSGDLDVSVRGALNPLVATRIMAFDGDVPEDVNVARELRPGTEALSREDAYALTDGEPFLTDADLRNLLQANIVDGAVGGVPVSELSDPERRVAAFDALEAAGTVPPAATEEDVDAALDGMTFASVYAEPNAEVTEAARAALTAIETKVGLNQTLDLGLDALSLASIYFLAAIGLAITFGVMGVINMAHGEFIMMGAYTGYVVQQIVPNHTASILLAIPLAFAVTFAAGVAMERLVIRFLYNRPLETLLATFGISIALQQLAKNIFGTQARPLTSPDWLGGAWTLNDVVSISTVRIAIFVLALIFLAVFLFIMKRTRLGLETRAVTQNRGMASAMGINPERVNMLTFGLGSGIAGIAGVAIGLYAQVTSEIGQAYIVQSFMTVVVGGVGNIWGTLLGAGLIGILQKGIEWFNPSNTLAAQTYMIIFIIIFIQFRPRGIIALKGRAAGD
ncbi:urea ABC transporter permease subunit UrtB [Maritimibacter sp. DP1N21-5]|uniref:urea ABC transporter permease subunit UrtB n=1 Tax=Maritimibacter sp. DP1N21-5 TaxID=2836867 RepID=UPI001C482930|nr:urea ABC transporter permease subunit UrtB [Maritimibacter sp. DP1N21-5]MBV7407732.1 urea ABC transporter permease subunit UrtB [Maritimibacter sp. DP1N21-5]